MADSGHKNCWRASGCSNHVRRIQAFGPLLAFELDRFAFVQRLIARVLDSGEMHEHILSRGTLDEPVPLGAVEPLHNPILFHVNSFGELPLFAFQRVLETPRAACTAPHCGIQAAQLLQNISENPGTKTSIVDGLPYIPLPKIGKWSSCYGRKRASKQEKFAFTKNLLSY
jgi:hypothetical protein